MSEAIRTTLCAPLWRLFHLQTHGKLRRAWHRLRSPRKILQMVVVCVLIAMYVAQVSIAIRYRPPSDPQRFLDLAPLAMAGILLLKFLGILIDRHHAGAGYRSEEMQWLLAGPFPRHQVRLYRIVGHSVSVFFTSVVAAIFMRFEVTSYPIALCGAFLTMMFTYLVHTTFAVIAASVSESSYRRARGAVCCLFVAVFAVCFLNAAQVAPPDTGWAFWKAVLAEMVRLSHTPCGRLVLAPYVVFTRIVAAPRIFPDFLTALAAGLALVYLALQLLLRVEVFVWRRGYANSRQAFAEEPQGQLGVVPCETRDGGLANRPLIPWFSGVGPVLWRQITALRRVSSGVVWLLLPAVLLAALVVYSIFNPEHGVFAIVWPVAMLTSMLLPGLLPFDFRGDLESLSRLKSLPIASSRVVGGQLLVPIALISAVQGAVLAPIVFRAPEQWFQVALAMVFLLATNTIIVSLENILFLLYPYRLGEFDMHATVRRILMLMAKFCVVFCAGILAVVITWIVTLLSGGLQSFEILRPGVQAWTLPVLYACQGLGLLSLTYPVVRMVCWSYDRYDLSEDNPL